MTIYTTMRGEDDSPPTNEEWNTLATEYNELRRNVEFMRSIFAKPGPVGPMGIPGRDGQDGRDAA